MRKLMVAMGGSIMLAVPLAQADVIGLGATVGYWNSDLSGYAAQKGDRVDLNSELKLDNDSNTDASIYIEHPIPILPNIRLNYTLVKQSGQGNLGSGYDMVPAGNVRSDLDLEQLDLTLYYELLDNWVNLDLGLTARDLSGELIVRETAGTGESKTAVDAVIPMGYLSARFDLPLTGLSAGGEGNFISYNGDSVRDFNVYGQYIIAMFQLRAGYRQMAIDYKDGTDRLDLEIDGPFISAGVTF
jgi:outer membrane protein